MIPLVTTTEVLRITVSANADVTVSGYQDGVSPPTFKQVTAATTGAARTICTAIAAVANPKNVSHITVKTTGGANTIVLDSYDSAGATTTTILTQAVLAADETFEYTHGGGFKVLDANCVVKYVIAGAVAATTLSVSGDTTLTGDLAVNGGDLTSTASTFNLLAANATTVNAFGAASTALNIGNANAATAFPGGISIPTGKNVTGAGTATVTGFATVSATALAGTLSTAAQPNVTSLGTIAALVAGTGTFSGQVTITTVAGDGLRIKDTNLFGANAAPSLRLYDATGGTTQGAIGFLSDTAGVLSIYNNVAAGTNAGEIWIRPNGSAGVGKYSSTGLSVTGTLGVTGAASNTIGGTASASSVLTLPAGTTGVSSLRIAAGAAPTSPVAGDIWSDGTHIYWRSTAGASVQLDN